MARKFEGRVAIVTGASKGIGAAIALQLAGDGASVVVNFASSRVGADRVVSQITAAGGKAVAVQADLSREADVKRLFAEAKQAFGRVDILVNNAGVYRFAPLEEISMEHFREQFDLNVLGLLLTTREAAKLMVRGGSIVNISSVVTSYAPPQSAVYSGTKGAVDVVTRALAKELGPRGIRVNSVNPGMVATEGAAELTSEDSEFRKQVEAQTPLGRIGLPEDIAPAVAFLASDEASWITGETLLIAGGLR